MVIDSWLQPSFLMFAYYSAIYRVMLHTLGSPTQTA
jgi:hypothetical protein